jgi:hypothetical protein
MIQKEKIGINLPNYVKEVDKYDRIFFRCRDRIEYLWHFKV